MRVATHLLLFSFFLFQTLSFAEEMTVQAASHFAEKKERNVDRVAMASQDLAIKKLNKLLKRYRNTAQEPVLLMRLADFYQQRGSLQFRIAHGKAHQAQRSLNLSQYKSSMRRSIKAIDTLERKYPRFPEFDRALFMRGKAYEEVGSKTKAKRDYLRFVKSYPESENAPSAFMSLATFAADANAHREAVSFLNEVEKRPESPHFPFALYKLAWSHYNLKELPKALSYLKTHVRFYDLKKERQKGLVSSDQAIRENTLSDVALFYLEAFEHNSSRFPTKEALDYFQEIENGPQLGRMIVRFAKLLRAHDHYQNLQAYTQQIVDEEFERPESVDVVLISFEYDLNKNRFKIIPQSTQSIAHLFDKNPKLKQTDAYLRAQKTLSEAAEKLQKLTLKNKRSNDVHILTRALAGVYDSFTQIVPETDPRILAVHYNLAETLFEIGNFPKATQHYRWVVSHWKPNKKIKLQDASLKSISSRYQELYKTKIIPKKLVAQSYAEESSKDLPPKVQSWIQWIDHHHQKWGKKNKNSFENFKFESNRTLYSLGKIKDATHRLAETATKNRHSKFAIPSASLVLDTLVKSKDWEKTHEVARKFMKVKAWKKASFYGKLYTLASDSQYKLIERSHKNNLHEKVMDQVDDFIRFYSKSPRMEDVLLLAGNTALKQDKPARGEKYFTTMIQRFPHSVHTGNAYLARAQLRERRYEFRNATKDYRRYFEMTKGGKISKKNRKELKEKLLLMSWVSADEHGLKKTLKVSNFCNNLQVTCDRYQALLALDGKRRDLKKVRTSPRANRAIWATAALESPKNLRFQDRLYLSRMIAGNWDKLDPLVQFRLIPHISQTIPESFERSRKDIDRMVRVRANEKSITRRVKKIQELEAVATKVVENIPWTRIRASVLNEVSQAYLDFTKKLGSLSEPKGLGAEEKELYQRTIQKILFPFEEKGQEIRRTAYEIASGFSVEKSTFDQISKPFFTDNPSQAKELRGEVSILKSVNIGLNNLHRFDPQGEWRAVAKSNVVYDDDPEKFLRKRWMEAVREKRWQKVAFFLQQTKGRKDLSEVHRSFMKAISLESAGAQSEGLAQLHEIREEMKTKERIQLNILLLSHYLRSHSKKKAEEVIDNLRDDGQEKGMIHAVKNAIEAFYVAYAADWTGVRLAVQDKKQLLGYARKSPLPDQSKWAGEKYLTVRDARAVASVSK